MKKVGAILAALLAATTVLAGCTSDGTAQTTQVIFVIVNATDSPQSTSYHAYDQDDSASVHGNFVRGMGVRIPARDAIVDQALMITDGLDDWVWHVGSLTFEPNGCADVWIIQARIVDDGEETRTEGEAHCDDGQRG